MFEGFKGFGTGTGHKIWCLFESIGQRIFKGEEGMMTIVLKYFKKRRAELNVSKSFI